MQFVSFFPLYTATITKEASEQLFTKRKENLLFNLLYLKTRETIFSLNVLNNSDHCKNPENKLVTCWIENERYYASQRKFKKLLNAFAVCFSKIIVIYISKYEILLYGYLVL